MFKIGDKVKVKWANERKNVDDFYGLADITVDNLEKITGIVTYVNEYSCEVKFDNNDCWLIPNDCLILISGDALIISSSVPGNFCGCKIAMKKRIKFSTFEFDYCDRCKKEIV